MAITDNFKDILKVARTIDNLDLYKKLSELQAAVYSLEEENRSLKERLSVRDNLTFEDEKYWLNKAGQIEGPFCHVCWDVDSKLVRMTKFEVLGVKGNYICDYCTNHRNKR